MYGFISQFDVCIVLSDKARTITVVKGGLLEHYWYFIGIMLELYWYSSLIKQSI